ncbi:unnamed protein product [Schistosoma turkestanicum]|nr:unnamed protein product [Schistosoma turkestanicum]
MSDKVTEDEQLISEAASCYRRKDFEQCLSIMEKLKDGKLNDTKVNINKALLSYVHKSRYSQSEQYISDLKRIAASEGMNLDDCFNKTVLSKHNSDRSDEAHISKDQLSNTAPQFVSRSSVMINLLYNYAVVLFYQHQYAQAEKLLANCLDIPSNLESGDVQTQHLREIQLNFQSSTCIDQSPSTLLQTIDLTPSNDTDLCRRIVLLWLEVSLRLFQTERVFGLCDYWILCLNTMSVVSETTSLSSNSQPLTFPSENTSCQSHNLSSNALSVLIGIRKPIQLYYIRACLLTGRLNEAESELNIFISEIDSKPNHNSLQKNNDFEENSPEFKITPDDEGDNCLDAKKPANSTDSDSENGTDHCSNIIWSTGNSVYFLQAQLAFLKGQYNDAVKLLTSMPSPSYNSTAMHDWESIIVKNNLSLIHHRTGRYTCAVIQLRHALKQIDKTVELAVQSDDKNVSYQQLNHQNDCSSAGEYSELFNQIPLHVFSLLEHYEIIYNYGIQLLFTHRPLEAFTILSQLVRIYPRNPRLWFRLAECCIKLHCPHNLSLWKMESRKRCIVESFGSGPFRKLLLACVNPQTIKSKFDETLLSSPSMEFAYLALRNASLLIPAFDKFITTNKSLNHDTIHSSSYALTLVKWSAKQFIATYPSPTPLFGIGLLHFLSALHVNISYVALCLNQFVDVISSASNLIIDSISHNETTLSTLSNSVGLVKRKTNLPNLGVIAPKIHSYLSRLYYAEALTYMDKVDEAIALLQIVTNNELDCIIHRLNGVCFARPFLFPNTDHIHKLSFINDSMKNSLNVNHQINHSLLLPSTYSRQSIIQPVDFPSNAIQSSSLLAYNLAVALAIQKQYSLSKQYLDLSIPGLYVTANEVDGRNWHLSTNELSEDSTLINHTNNHPCKLLPTAVILLQIYLALRLNDQKQAIELIRDNFGHLAMANRLNSIIHMHNNNDNNNSNNELHSAPSNAHDPSNHHHHPNHPDHPPIIGSGKHFPSHLTDLQQQLMKSQPIQHNTTNNNNNGMIAHQIHSTPTMPQIQQSTMSNNTTQTNNQRINLWTPCQQFRQSQIQQNQSMYYSPLLQTQSTLNNYDYANCWDPTISSSTTGIITASNENDWPPLS